MAQPHLSHHTALPATQQANNSRIGQRLFRSGAEDTLPLTIRHERIYILPTTRGLAFLCVLAIMLMASINYGLNLGYALCFILIGLFFSCLLSTYKNLIGIRFELVAVEDTYHGSPLQYHIKLSEQKKRHRCSVSISTEDANDTFDISANGSVDARLQIKKTKRGVHSLGRLTLSSDFPLGLWRGWGYVHTPAKSYVYPKPEQPVVGYAGCNEINNGSPAKQITEQEYAGLKPYENTDSPSRIAWKKVASGAGWYSKQFESLSEQSELAIRWADTPATLNVEERLSRLCSWVNLAIEDNSSFTFELPGTGTTIRSSSREHGLDCLRALATYQDNSIE